MENVPTGQASLYVDITCPLCEKSMAMSNSVELITGVHVCFSCCHMPHERKVEILLLRLLAQRESSQQQVPQGRFQGQVERAKKRSHIIERLNQIETWVGNVDVHFTTNHETSVIPKLIDSIIRTIRELKKEV